MVLHLFRIAAYCNLMETWAAVIIGSKSLYCKYFYGAETVFTGSAITPPKMNLFG